MGKSLGILSACCLLERRGRTRNRRERFEIWFWGVLRVQAEGWPLPHVIEGKIARNSKQPWLEARLSVVGVTALQDAQPRFLDQVIDGISPSHKVGEVADEPILILSDQSVQESDISLAKTTRNLMRICVHHRHRRHIVFAHTQGIRLR